jgi:hypothetical protein
MPGVLSFDFFTISLGERRYCCFHLMRNQNCEGDYASDGWGGLLHSELSDPCDNVMRPEVTPTIFSCFRGALRTRTHLYLLAVRLLSPHCDLMSLEGTGPCSGGFSHKWEGPGHSGLTLWGMEWVEASWPEMVSSHRSLT